MPSIHRIEVVIKTEFIFKNFFGPEFLIGHLWPSLPILMRLLCCEPQVQSIASEQLKATP